MFRIDSNEIYNIYDSIVIGGARCGVVLKALNKHLIVTGCDLSLRVCALRSGVGEYGLK